MVSTVVPATALTLRRIGWLMYRVVR